METTPRMQRATVAVVAVLALAGPYPAFADPPLRSLAALQARIRPGTEVVVADGEGRAFAGRFVRADDDGVHVSIPGVRKPRRVAVSEVATVTRVGDSLTRGILLGAGAGILVATPFVTTPTADRFTCSYDYCRPFCVSDGCRLATGISIGVAATVIGALLDRRVVGRQVIYEADAGREPAALSIVPYPVHGGAAVRVAVKF